MWVVVARLSVSVPELGMLMMNITLVRVCAVVRDLPKEPPDWRATVFSMELRLDVS